MSEEKKQYADTLEREPESVKNMFARVAKVYDPINRAMCFGMDTIWRRKLVKSLAPRQKRAQKYSFIDIACGSGDVALDALKLYPQANLTCSDFCPEMLDCARAKIEKNKFLERAKFAEADCENLPFADETFDGATVSFGFRNFKNRQKCLREIFRILKPNGVFAMLEVARANRFTRPLQNIFMRGIVPLIAHLFGGDKKDYVYLGKSAMEFPPKQEIEKMFTDAGFCNVKTTSLAFGLVAITRAQKL